MLVYPTERGIRVDARPSLETFSRLATLDELIRDRVATKIELIPVSDALIWPEDGEDRLGAISLPNPLGPSPGDVERAASMVAADIISWMDSRAGPSSGRLGIQLRVSVDGKGLEISYRVMVLELEDYPEEYGPKPYSG